MTIAITGANGQLGRATLSFLLEKTDSSNVVAVVRDRANLADLSGVGLTIREATYDDPQTLMNAFEDVDVLLQISTSAVGEAATRQEYHVVNAAKQQGIKHVVYTSTLNPHPNAHFMATETCLQTEKAIRESGMYYTFFRNSMYMETIPLFIGDGLHNGQIYYPAGNGRVSFVSRVDIAEAISHLLLQPEIENATYDITGDKSFSFGDLAALLRQERQLDAVYENIDDEHFQAELVKIGMPLQEVDFYLSMAKSIRSGEFELVDGGLEKLLGRKRKTLQHYIRSL